MAYHCGLREVAWDLMNFCRGLRGIFRCLRGLQGIPGSCKDASLVLRGFHGSTSGSQGRYGASGGFRGAWGPWGHLMASQRLQWRFMGPQRTLERFRGSLGRFVGFSAGFRYGHGAPKIPSEAHLKLPETILRPLKFPMELPKTSPKPFGTSSL